MHRTSSGIETGTVRNVDSMLKVLVITPIYPNPVNPREGIFIQRQIVELSRLNIQCRVLTYRSAPPPFPRWLVRRTWLRYYLKKMFIRLDRQGIPVETAFYRSLVKPDEDVVPAIGQGLIDHIGRSEHLRHSDVIYAHFLWTAGGAALEVRNCLGLPVVAIARGSEMHDWQQMRPLCRHHVEQVLRQGDVILANCHYLRKRADEMVPGSGDRIPVIYNGCDAEIFKPAQQKASVQKTLGLGDSRILLFCGDIIARKGIVELTLMWERFTRLRSNWKLVLVGKPVEHSLVRELKNIGGDRVLFTGLASQKSVLKYLQASDIYIQPSRLEGLANATMEAMAVGLPVISTDTCGQGELIQHGVNGLMVPPEDADALLSALMSMVEDPRTARELGDRARKTIITKFNPRREAAKLAEILEQTARKKS